MKYSIIIAVYNRLEEVKELLESAEKLEGNRCLFELLFVDDGSKDGFKEFIEQYHSASGLQIRAIYQQNQGPSAAERGRGAFWPNVGGAALICSYFSGMINSCQL